MWDLECSQRVEYQVAGRRCVSFTVRLSSSGMALRTAAQLEADSDVLFALALSDPTKPAQIMGHVAKKEADKAWIVFNPEQSATQPIRDYIRHKVVPDVEKAIGQGTVCVTRVHGLAEFCAEFMPPAAGHGGHATDDFTAATSVTLNAPDARVADLNAQLLEAQQANAEMAQRLATAERTAAAARLEADQAMGQASVPMATAAEGPVDVALTFRNAVKTHRTFFGAVGGGAFVVGALLTLIVAQATRSAAPACPPAATAAAAPAVPAPAPAASASAGASPTPVAAPPAVAPVPVAQAPEPAAPPPASAEPVAVPPRKHDASARKPAPAARSSRRAVPPPEAENMAPPSPKAPAPKSKASPGRKDDAFLDSVFP